MAGQKRNYCLPYAHRPGSEAWMELISLSLESHLLNSGQFQHSTDYFCQQTYQGSHWQCLLVHAALNESPRHSIGSCPTFSLTERIWSMKRPSPSSLSSTQLFTLHNFWKVFWDHSSHLEDLFEISRRELIGKGCQPFWEERGDCQKHKTMSYWKPQVLSCQLALQFFQLHSFLALQAFSLFLSLGINIIFILILNS